MSTVQELRHVNGGVIQCANCLAYLGNQRAIATTEHGVKFFCKMEPDDQPTESCYLQWRRKYQ